MSMATNGPAEITLTSRIKPYLLRFIYSYLQKRSFILGINTYYIIDDTTLQRILSLYDIRGAGE